MTAPEFQSNTDRNKFLFEEDILRIQLICNSLKAFVAEEPRPHTSEIEARALVRYLNQDLRALLRNITKFHEAIIHVRRDTEFARKAALELLAEDQARLIALSTDVVTLLQPIFRGRAEPDMDRLRTTTAAFLAALHSYLDWLKNFTADNSIAC